MGGIATVAGRGRKPKPTKLKEPNGNAGKRALNKNEPKFKQVTNIELLKWLELLAVEMCKSVFPELLANDLDLLTLGDCIIWKHFVWRTHGGEKKLSPTHLLIYELPQCKTH